MTPYDDDDVFDPDASFGIRERGRRLAHANSLFQSGAGGRDDNEAVWAYAEDVFAEACAEVKRLRDANGLCASRDPETP